MGRCGRRRVERERAENRDGDGEFTGEGREGLSVQFRSVFISSRVGSRSDLCLTSNSLKGKSVLDLEYKRGLPMHLIKNEGPSVGTAGGL